MESRFLATVVAQESDGQATAVADTWALEVADNPDPYILESHPYDLETGPDGTIHAVSIGQFTKQGAVPNSGAVLRIQQGETCEVLLSGLSSHTSIDVNDAGDAYVTLNDVGAPGSGQFVRYDGLTSMAGSSPADATAAPAAASEPAAQLQALPKTGSIPLHAAWIAPFVGLALVTAGILLGIRRRPATTEHQRQP